jgi:hypothetical protein
MAWALVPNSGSRKALMNYDRSKLRHVIHEAIVAFVDEHPDIHLHEPDNVKELARFIRDAIETLETPAPPTP